MSKLTTRFAGAIAGIAAALLFPVGVALADDPAPVPNPTGDSDTWVPYAGLPDTAGVSPHKTGTDASSGKSRAPVVTPPVDPNNPRSSLPNPYLIFRW